MPTLSVKRLFSVLLLCSSSPLLCQAQFEHFVWQGGAGSWDDSSSWIGGVAPDNDNAIVLIDDGNSTSSHVTINTATELHTLNLDAGDQLTTNNTVRIHHEVNNAGHINLLQSSSIEIVDTLILRGGGIVTLQRPFVVNAPGFPGIGLVNLDNTIQGFTLTSLGSVLNFGTVEANESGETFRLGGTNHGLLRASNGGQLVYGPGGQNTGTLIVEAGSHATIGGSGQFPLRGGTYIAPDNLASPGITVSGDIASIETKGTLELLPNEIDGHMVNHGHWLFRPGGPFDVGQVEFNGGGMIELSQSVWRPSNSSVVSGSVNNLDNTISGDGQLELVELSNAGVIEASGSDQGLTFVMRTFGSDAGDIVNRGTMRVSQGSALRFRRDGSNVERVLSNAGGVIEVDVDSTFESQIKVLGGAIQGPDPSVGVGTLEAAVEGVTLSGAFDLQYSAIINSMQLEGVARVSQSLLQFNGDLVELSGNGSLRLENADVEHPDPFGQHRTLLNRSITIEGTGNLMLHRIHNEGTIVADGAVPGLGLVIDVEVNEFSEFTNRGELRAQNGGVLFSSIVDNRGGTIVADAGSSVEIDRILGGSIESMGSGVIRAEELIDLTVNATVVPTDFSNNLITLSGRIVNHGTIGLIQPMPHRIASGNTLFLGGTGQVTLNDDQNNFTFLFNEEDHLITGQGQLEAVALYNFGQISTTDELAIRAESINNYGSIVGELRFDRGSVSNDVTFINSGLLQPTQNGDFFHMVMGEFASGVHFENTVDGTVAVSLGGVGQSTLIDIEGSAGLAGVLAIELLGGGSPVMYGDEWIVLRTEPASLSGTFDAIDGAIVGTALALAVTYDTDIANPHAFVKITAALPGDANLDGTVDGQDFVAWNDGKFAPGTWASGDFNGDGITNGIDFVIWNDNKFTSVDMNVVPEPNALSMVMLVALGLFALRRQAIT